MDLVTRTADWMLMHPLESPGASGATEHEERLGALAILASELERLPGLTGPVGAAGAARATIAHRLAEIPPQAAFVDQDGAFGRWMSVAAVAEHEGAPRLAQLIVDRIAVLLHTSLAGTTGHGDRHREELGMCWTRRGRLARIAGKLDDARECYREAVRKVTKLPWLDARPQAELGLATVAVDHGNFPDAERRLTALLAHRPAVAPLYRIPAHQLLALAKRKRRDFVDALLHGWSAFDLLEQQDVRRQEILLSMAEIATEMGDLDAAAHGFDAVLASGPPIRVRVSALVGAVSTSIRWQQSRVLDARAGARLAEYAAKLEELLATALAPRDEMRVLLALVESASLRARPTGSTATWLDAAARIATRHGFYEQQFRVDALRAQLYADVVPPVDAPSASPAPLPAVAYDVRRVKPQRHPALVRLVRTTLA